MRKMQKSAGCQAETMDSRHRLLQRGEVGPGEACVRVGRRRVVEACRRRRRRGWASPGKRREPDRGRQIERRARGQGNEPKRSCLRPPCRIAAEEKGKMVEADEGGEKKMEAIRRLQSVR